MEQQINEQTASKAHTVATEGSNGENKVEVSLGKFKDANALLSAYNSLQSEFTKRCQKIKELESALAVEKVSTPTDCQLEKEVKQDITEKDKEEILKGYLMELIGGKQKAIVMDGFGVGVKTPAERPKTIEQAGILAKELLK